MTAFQTLTLLDADLDVLLRMRHAKPRFSPGASTFSIALGRTIFSPFFGVTLCIANVFVSAWTDSGRRFLPLLLAMRRVATGIAGATPISRPQE
jgi:hypothetical protein